MMAKKNKVKKKDAAKKDKHAGKKKKPAKGLPAHSNKQSEKKSASSTALAVEKKYPEPKNKLVLEYIIHASPALLYEFLTSPSGMSEWFADNVNVIGNQYSFYWDGSMQEARILSSKEGKYIRLQWTDRTPDTYFEFRIEKNELTDELSLIITDFAETPDEKNSLEVLWQGQVQRLMKVIGSKV
ncbi:MAG TPA: START-like domain-containing protein [Bacteroidia bacterium]